VTSERGDRYSAGGHEADPTLPTASTCQCPSQATPTRRSRPGASRLINCVCVHLVEIWLSILVHKLLRRRNFRSIDDLRTQVLAFIDYFNRTMAKLFKWTYRGKPLHA
jgi:hypothetical protein